MTYQEQLNPWVIHQFLPELTRRTVARFRRRGEAEAYLKLMQQMRPTFHFAIAFDTPPTEAAQPVAVPTTVSIAVPATKRSRAKSKKGVIAAG